MHTESLKPEGRDVLARLGRALSHPARVAILDILARRGTCICGDIVDELPLAQSTVSQHLKVLKEAGLIQGSIEGVRTCYCLDWEALLAARSRFAGFFSLLDSYHPSKTCC